MSPLILPYEGAAALRGELRREGFLAEMDAVMPWARLLALIEPRYPSDAL